ncbi:SpoIIE family protein phosphatase [Amycolatopsis heterodermiae]
MATVLLARIDPTTGHTQLANGGHPEPVLVGTTGDTTSSPTPTTPCSWPSAAPPVRRDQPSSVNPLLAAGPGPRRRSRSDEDTCLTGRTRGQSRPEANGSAARCGASQ